LRMDQSREFRQKLKRFEHDMRRTVPPARPELIQEPAIGKSRLSSRYDRRARDIAARILQLAAGPGGVWGASL
jgi:hypothetical protein